AQAAQAASTRQIAEKLNKGYREIGVAQASTDNTSAIAAPSLLRRVAAAVLSRIAPGSAPQAQPSTPPIAVPAEPTTATPSAKPAPRARKAPRTAEPTVYDPTVRVNLDPQDWFWATWRRPYPLKRQPATPFDRADALQRLRQMSSWKWENVIPESMTPEEALFWFHARQIVDQKWYLKPPQLAEQLASESIPVVDSLEIVRTMKGTIQPDLMQMLGALYSPQELVARLMRESGWRETTLRSLIAGFRRHILPYLSHQERAQISQSLRPYLKQVQWPAKVQDLPHPAFYFAAMLGEHHDLLQGIVEGWHDERYSFYKWADYLELAQEIVFGLGDPRAVEAHVRRLNLRLTDPSHMRAWLAHTEDRALDLVYATIQAQTQPEAAAALSQIFALVASPAAAPHMLSLTQESQAPQVARAWLNAHPAHTIAGLLPLADGRDAQAKAATELLRRFVRRGYGEQIEQALAELPADVATRLRANVITGAQPRLPAFDEQTTPPWLAEALRSLPTSKPAKLPVWARPSELPPITAGTHVLSVEQMEAVLRSVQRAKKDEPNDLINALKQHADRASLDHFAWSLFEEWLAGGAPSKDNWAFFGLGLLGGDATAIKLAPLICVWPGESQHQRATNGLECLRLIGSDTALMQISSIAKKVKFKAMQKRAVECMDQIAEERGLSRAQLDDRIVPDCDLDARGERIFDYGPRQFRFVLGPEMKPMLRDPEGKLKPNLPTPTAKDDAAKANQALAEWKLLKKQIADVASMEAARLEQAMVTGRRWTRDEFETLLVPHPLLSHLVRALIWGVYDQQGALSVTFRVTEDQSYASSADEVVETLSADATIGLIHPLSLADNERAAWGEILSDYEIVQPFPQLGRAIQRLQAHEQSITDITRFNGVSIPAPKLIFGLDRLGWTRDLPGNSGHFTGHFKPFYHANLTAVIQYKGGVAPYGIIDAPEQTIEYIAFMPGILKAEYSPEHKARLVLGDVDPIVLSEALNDMRGLTAPAK
ncbi:MAG TPA: DUF4132 domain-containing protein, partial [Herpetosiphonaceae bacterium]